MAEISAFIFKGSAVGAFCFGRIGFVAADFNVIKAAAVTIFTVICAVVYVASNVSVSFHNLKTSFSFCFYFSHQRRFYSKDVLFFEIFHKIL